MYLVIVPEVVDLLVGLQVGVVEYLLQLFLLGPVDVPVLDVGLYFPPAPSLHGLQDAVLEVGLEAYAAGLGRVVFLLDEFPEVLGHNIIIIRRVTVSVYILYLHYKR